MRAPSPFHSIVSCFGLLFSIGVPQGVRAQEALDTNAVGPRPQCLFSPTPACIFRLDELSEQPRLLRMPALESSLRLLQRKDTGMVRLRVVLDTTGHVEPAVVTVVTAPDSNLARKARQAVLSAVYTPARVYGRPVRAKFVVSLGYTVP